MTWRLIESDVRAGLATLEPESVQTCVTSPPYWGLRAYGTSPVVWDEPVGGCEHEWGAPLRSYKANEIPGPSTNVPKNGAYRSVGKEAGNVCARCGAWRGELGSEPDPELFVAHLVDVFAAVKRVLRKDGTLWVNINGSYSGSGKGPTGHNGIGNQTQRQGFVGSRGQRLDSSHGESGHTSGVPPIRGYPAKCLIPTPWLLGLAMIADGWILRSSIIWAKKAPMPESVTDRPTGAYEYVLLFSKQGTYYYDSEAVREEAKYGYSTNTNSAAGMYGRVREADPDDHRANPKGTTRNGDGTGGRNLRNVWHLGPEPYADAHFATFPTEIPRRAILAGTSQRGACAKCGAGWRRVVDKPFVGSYHDHKADGIEYGLRQAGRGRASTWTPGTTVGWSPTCRCDDSRPPVPQVVLDPFAGSGTTLLVAERNGRDSIGIELSPTYAAMARKRLESDAPLVAEIETRTNGYTPDLFDAPRAAGG